MMRITSVAVICSHLSMLCSKALLTKLLFGALLLYFFMSSLKGLRYFSMTLLTIFCCSSSKSVQ